VEEDGLEDDVEEGDERCGLLALDAGKIPE